MTRSRSVMTCITEIMSRVTHDSVEFPSGCCSIPIFKEACRKANLSTEQPMVDAVGDDF